MNKKQTKKIDRCNIDILFKKYLEDTFNHTNTRKNEEREGATKFSIENTDGAFEGHIKIRLFRFEDPGPSSIIEAVDMVKQRI